jgi:predicted nuclease of predicted toxin-antitoxin system
MRILLDECLPKKFKNCFVGHECSTAAEVGMAGLKNGELLASAERGGFRVFVTLDKGIRYQQNLAWRSIAIIIIRAKSNRLVDLLPHADSCIASLDLPPGQVAVVGSN